MAQEPLRLKRSMGLMLAPQSFCTWRAIAESLLTMNEWNVCSILIIFQYPGSIPILFILLSAVLKKYSNFVGHPVYLNKEQVNELQPLWLLDPKTITKEQYDEFYRFVANTYMKPRFTLHYKVRTKKVNEFRSKCDLISNIVFHLSDWCSIEYSCITLHPFIKAKSDGFISTHWSRCLVVHA